MMQLCGDIDMDVLELIAKAESQDVWVVLHPCPETEGVEHEIFKAASDLHALLFVVFLQLALGDEIIGNLVSHSQAHDLNVENKGSQTQPFSDL